MSKFSVKKPFTVFVAVIAVLVLGVVAYLKMTPDLLPNMDFPYVMIMTTYPGASPEKVEAEITKPMEQSMSTLEHIKEVSSTSGENYSMVMLEFEEAVNMDTIGVDIQQQITSLSAGWDDMVGAPYVLKINPSLLPVEVAAVSMEGMKTVELTQFLNDTLMNKLEGIPGVARISTSGMIEQELHVILDQDKIDALNETIAGAVNKKLDDAAAELEDAKEELEDTKNQLSGAQNKLNEGKDALIQGEATLKEKKKELEAMEAQLREQLAAAQAGKEELDSACNTLNALNNAATGVVSAQKEANTRLKNLESVQAQGLAAAALESGVAALEAEVAQLQEKLLAADPESAEYGELAAQLAQKQAELAAKNTELLTAKASYEAALAALGVTEENLPIAIEAAKTAVQLADAAVENMDKLLAEQGMDRQTLSETLAQLKDQQAQLNAGIAQLENALTELEAGKLTLEEAQEALNDQKTAGLLEMSSAAAQLAVGTSTVTQALTQIETGLETLEDSRGDALAAADLNGIITMDTITGILTAQNFAMPAGYVEQDDISYMVSVGENITDQETLENLLLFDLGLEDVEPVYLKDVAVVMLTDNRNETYAKLDGEDGIVLTFEKQSTYATAETTNNIQARFRQLEGQYPGLQFVALMNQGDYIYMIVESILSSLLLGAVFAVKMGS